MSAFNGLKFTQKGLNLQAKAQIGAELQYTRIGIGDGQYTGDIKQLNGLIHEVLSLPITSIRVKDNGQAIVGSAFSNADLSVGFYLREIGIYATDPDEGEILYCYANAGAFAGYVPPAGGGDVVEKEVELVTTVGTAPNVTAIIDPSVFATVGAVDARVAVVQEALGEHTDNAEIHVTLAQKAAWDAKENAAKKGQPGGYAPLDLTAKVPTSHLPDSILGQVEYISTWNAATNTPELPDAAEAKGNYYVTETAGTYAGIEFKVGDWVISNGTEWQKVDNTDAVPTVFGRTGNILAAAGDYSAEQISLDSPNFSASNVQSALEEVFQSGSLIVLGNSPNIDVLRTEGVYFKASAHDVMGLPVPVDPNTRMVLVVSSAPAGKYNNAVMQFLYITPPGGPGNTQAFSRYGEGSNVWFGWSEMGGGLPAPSGKHTVVVAASDSPWMLKDSADYVCGGSGDQAVIHSAFDTAGAVKVTLLPGTYYTNGKLTLPAGAVLEGGGINTVIKPQSSAGALMEDSFLYVEGAGIEVRHLCIDLSDVTQFDSDMIPAIYVQNNTTVKPCVISGVSITNVTSTPTVPPMNVFTVGYVIVRDVQCSGYVTFLVGSGAVMENSQVWNVRLQGGFPRVSGCRIGVDNPSVELARAFIVANDATFTDNCVVGAVVGNSANSSVISNNRIILKTATARALTVGIGNVVSGNRISYMPYPEQPAAPYGSAVELSGPANRMQGNVIDGFISEVLCTTTSANDIPSNIVNGKGLAYPTLLTATSDRIVYTQPAPVAGTTSLYNVNPVIVAVYFRTTATTNVTITLEYTDQGGAQTLEMVPTAAFPSGSYSAPLAFITPTAGNITVTARASVANVLTVSSSVWGV